MSELLFEGYSVPSIAYGIDALFSFYGNGHSLDDGGIVISAGHTATHVLPIFGGRGVLEQAKRISYGGTQATDYMLKLMQLKYPTFPTKMTTNQAQQLVHDHCHFAEDYMKHLKEFENRETFVERDRIIQFPFVAPVIEEKTEEDLARQAARKEEATRRLREAAAKTRLDKLIIQEQEFEAFTQLKGAKQTEKKSEWVARLKSHGFKDEADLDDVLKKLETSIKRARNKELGIEETEEKVFRSENATICDGGFKIDISFRFLCVYQEPPSFPLLDMPDDMLSEAEKRDKKKQRLLKAGYDARIRAKRAKEEEKAREVR
ncbi:hypothetical protein BC936DRAFT_141645 [Jimgerdemannia flammicorona]|uniref:Uncharacterized protein n=2 Tax=Jimgerdemannia flammicorona TaxID=994334 RepID=A0A433QM31_9FUNG|nr:hypothetical protein BC936DRAFT_141645 [Jimgerdemannia flammicorona]RUS30831.1 hypothetical protein BC938DRAFT_478912 [Jimgerdemannia flammicorona]